MKRCFPSRTNLSFLSVGLFALLSLLSFFPGSARATNYTLWIHGRNSPATTKPGNYADFSYWGSATVSAGVNKKAVNWTGTDYVSAQNYRVRDALDCFCTGTNWCYIAVHSAGDYQIGYALSMYGGSARYKKTPSPNSAGQCANSDGKTQTGWNIKWVRVASGGSGGSELADAGSWASSEKLVQDLVTTTARAKYNHNTTYGIWFYNYAGASGTLYSGILPGQDDEAVAYHTTGGVSGSTGAAFGNPSDWYSNDLNLGTAACEGGAAKWSYHSLKLRDDGETYKHSGGGAWGGIIGPVRSDVVKYAL
jgi:hypothetical protein